MRAGRSGTPARRPQVTDPFLDKIEEWVEASQGKIRADKVHEKLVALGYRRVGPVDPAGGRGGEEGLPVGPCPGASAVGHRAGAVAAVRLRRRPGRSSGVKTVLFVAWLAWSRFRVVIALRDKTQPSVIAALDRTFRLLGGVPTYVLTDNEKTVTVEHIAGVPVRNREAVSFGRHYGVTVLTCEPADPASQGRGGGGGQDQQGRPGADRDQPARRLRLASPSWSRRARSSWTQVNDRQHRVTRRAPVEMLAEERARLHRVPDRAAHGGVRAGPPGADRTPRWWPSNTASTRCRSSCCGEQVWVRATGVGAGERIVIVHHGRSGSGRGGPACPRATPGIPAHRR